MWFYNDRISSYSFQIYARDLLPQFMNTSAVAEGGFASFSPCAPLPWDFEYEKNYAQMHR